MKKLTLSLLVTAAFVAPVSAMQPVKKGAIMKDGSTLQQENVLVPVSYQITKLGNQDVIFFGLESDGFARRSFDVNNPNRTYEGIDTTGFNIVTTPGVHVVKHRVAGTRKVVAQRTETAVVPFQAHQVARVAQK